MMVGQFLLVGSVTAVAAGDPDGGYRGHYQDVDDRGDRGRVTFKLARNGREIRAFRATPLAVCINPNAIGGIEVVPVPFRFDMVKVRRDGRFRKRDTVRADPPSDATQYYEVSGRLKNGRVQNGRMVLDKRCSSSETFTAKRRP